MKLPAKRIRHSEQGQTILLVAVSIVALLSMAALAIDVVTLYVAKSEIQRAADAIALAGAKAIADSGVTTLSGTDPNLPAAITLAQIMASAAIAAAANANPVNGNPPQPPTVAFDFTTHGNNNPNVTVTVQQTNLPTFFARIWARATASTQATATAEAYNPANMQEFTPTATQCVKPWLMANGDPTRGTPNGGTLPQLIDPTTGLLESNVSALIGASFFLTSNCNSAQPQCSALIKAQLNLQAGGYSGATPPYAAGVFYMPAEAGSVNIASACASGWNRYAQSVAGCDTTLYSCGGGSTNANWDPTENPNQGTSTGDTKSDTALGTECLLGLNSPGGTGPSGSAPGLDQDVISYGGWPSTAAQITSESGGLKGSLISTSNSIVTIPIIQETSFNPGIHGVTVIGFLQAFINYVGYPGASAPPPFANYGDVNITVMNVVACSQTPNTSPPVSGANATCSPSTGQCPGGGNTAIPVRLISTPAPTP